MKITITLPDEIAERVRQRPDSDAFVTRAVEEALAKEPPPSTLGPEEPSRWAKIVERVRSESSSLGSSAKKFDADRREFRRNLHFPHDER